MSQYAFLSVPDPEYLLEADRLQQSAQKNAAPDEEIIAAARKECDEGWVSESRQVYGPFLPAGLKDIIVVMFYVDLYSR